MWEEEAGVMRNAMTTRAPGGANNIIGISLLKQIPDHNANLCFLICEIV